MKRVITLYCYGVYSSITGEVQNLSALANYLNQFEERELLQALSDFNVLFYLSNCDVLPMREHMSPLLEAVRTHDVAAALQWAHEEQWSTMQHLLQASGMSLLLLFTCGKGICEHGVKI